MSKKDICIAIEVLEERIKQLQVQNELQFNLIEDILTELKTDVSDKIDEHDKKLHEHASFIGFARGAVVGLITLIGLVGIKYIMFVGM